MTMVQIFNRHRELVRQLKKLELHLDREGTTGVPSAGHGISFDHIPGTNDALAARMQRLDGLEALYARLDEERAALRLRIDAHLQTLTSYRMLSILSLYYLQGMTDEAIAESLFMDDRYICKLRNQYMRTLSESASA